MAHVRRFLLLRHLRAEPTSHVIRWRSGTAVTSGRGLAFWFLPLSTSISEVPVDDREAPFLVTVATSDFQTVAVQGVVVWRIADPNRAAERVDFSIDLVTGQHREQPLERISGLVVPLARQLAERVASGLGLREVLARGTEPIRAAIEVGLRAEADLRELGLEVCAVRVAAVQAAAEVERALQTPTRERIQQDADEATFRRRALAVEKERAIQENELQNQIELAAREEQLVAQQGRNERLRVEQEAEALQVGAEAAAKRVRVEAEAEAARIRATELARCEAERDRMAVYRDLPPQVLFGLAARSLGENLEHIEHLAVGSDWIAPVLGQLATAGTKALEQR